MRRLRLALWLAALFFAGAAPAHAAFELGTGVCETSTSTGTGTINLAGAYTAGPVDYLSFLSQITSGNTVPYTIESSDGKFEHGTGTFTDATPDTLSRTAGFSSDGVGVALNLPAGTHVVCLQWGEETFTGGNLTPYFASIELGHASDTTIERSSAGEITVEGTAIVEVNDSPTLGTITTTGTIELGHASDTTIARASAGEVTIEGVSIVEVNDSPTLGTITTTGNVELGHASDTTLARTAAGEASLEGDAIKHAGKQTIWVPASALIPNTTNGCASARNETTTNDVMHATCDFDTTTEEYAQFSVTFPKNWNEGTVTLQFYWSHPSTATNFGVVWEGVCQANSDSDALDTAFGTEQEIADTGGTTDDVFITSETPAITCAGTPAEGDIIMFRVNREPANGSDTMAVDARLMGVKVLYTDNASSDD